MRKILFVASDNSKNSGAFQCMVELCRQIKLDGQFYPIVVVPKKGMGTELLDGEKIEWKNIRSYTWVVDNRNFKSICVVLVKNILNWFSIYKIEKLIKRENIELVHVNTIWSYVGADAAIKTRRPLIWHIREGLDIDQNKQLYSDKCFNKIQYADKVIFVSNYLMEHYHNKIMTKKRMVVYDGVNPEKFLNTDIKYSNDVIRFINVGGFSSNKGQKYIIEAAKLLVCHGIKNFHITFVGTGKVEKQLIQKVLDDGLADFFSFEGLRDDVTVY